MAEGKGNRAKNQTRDEKGKFPRISDAAEEGIGRDYVAGGKHADIARRYGVCVPTVYLVLKRNGIAARGSNAFTHKQEVVIALRYAAGETPQVLAAEHGVKSDTIIAVVRRQKVPTRSLAAAHRRYTLDESAFDSPLSDQAAYWLGMLLADGNISILKHGAHMVRLGLKTSDREHVEALARFLKTERPLLIRKPRLGGPIKDTGSAVLTVTSTPLAQNLMKLGIVPRKSLIASMPEELRFNRHAWRGMVDGDGYLQVVVRTVTIGLTGSLAVCEQFSAFCQRLGCIPLAVSPLANIWRATASGEKARRIIYELYREPNDALERKLAIAHDALSLHFD